MSIIEVFAALRDLSRTDKLRALQFLVAELAKEENALLESDASSIAWQLHQSHEAAKILDQILKENREADQEKLAQIMPGSVYEVWSPEASAETVQAMIVHKYADDTSEQADTAKFALSWSEWHTWDDIKSHVCTVPKMPGVCEVRVRGVEERLTIGNTSDLQRRMHELMGGSPSHSSGERIGKSEDTSQLQVRWAITEQHVDVGKALLHQYKEQFGALPKHRRRI